VSVRAADTTLEKLYPTLSPRERLRAALFAAARQDGEQVERLTRSCPRKTYTQPDDAYLAALEASHLTGLRFAVLWLNASRLHDLYALQRRTIEEKRRAMGWGLVLGANAAWQEAGQAGGYFDVDGETPDMSEAIEAGAAIIDDVLEQSRLSSKLDDRLASLDADQRRTVVELRSLREAMARFCGRVDLEPDQLLAWVAPLLTELEGSDGVLKDETVPVDEGIVAGLTRLFAQGWPESVLRPEAV
jgi:hypothetical protein